MGDGLPGWTCPDIDDVLRLVRRWRRAGAIPEDEAVDAARKLEAVRSANRQLRERCGELLRDAAERRG